MDQLRKAAQQALESLSDAEPGHAAQILREALAEPAEQPVVAWLHPTQGHMQRRTETMTPDVMASYERGGWIPLCHCLNAAPEAPQPAKREQLTSRELKHVIQNVPEPLDPENVGRWVVNVCRAVIAAYERKNGITKE